MHQEIQYQSQAHTTQHPFLIYTLLSFFQLDAHSALGEKIKTNRKMILIITVDPVEVKRKANKAISMMRGKSPPSEHILETIIKKKPFWF